MHIGDRENDIYEFFCQCEDFGAHFLIRSCVNRLANEATISEEVGRQEDAYKQSITSTDADGQEVTTTLDVKVKHVRLHPPIGKENQYPDLNGPLHCAG